MPDSTSPTSNHPSRRPRTLRWLAAGAAGLFGLGIAVAATSTSHASPDQANFSLSDGSVGFIPSSIAPGSWRATGTHDGGEVLSDY